MSDGKKDEFEVSCPKCRRRVKVSVAQAEAAKKVKCTCGEEILLATGGI